jgi:hypothetical protein
MTTLLYARCGGTIGELKLLLTAALSCALEKGLKEITKDVVDACGYISPSSRKNKRVPI